MSASIPAQVPVFTVLLDGPSGDDILAIHQNNPNDEITALATYIGMVGSGLGQSYSTDLLSYIQKARQSFRLSYVNATTLQVSQGESMVTNVSGSQRVMRRNTSTTNITALNLDSGASFAVSTTYYVYQIADAISTTVTFVISTSASVPVTAPTRYSLVGKFATDSSGNIIQTSVTSFVGNVVVNEQYLETGASATGTTIMPADNSTPSNIEGDQYMTIDYVPQDALNLLEIDVIWIGASSASNYQAAALFQDAVSAALAVGVHKGAADEMNAIIFRHMMLAGTVNKTTFNVRAGNGDSGTTTFNGRLGSQMYGGSLASSIRIREYRRVYA